jgi:tRNA pseudouridine38-40 synthase
MLPSVIRHSSFGNSSFAMPVFKLTLSYDGTEFHGWQRQPERRTVQGELERAWFEITGDTARLAGASRTDAGVHAAGQVASIESSTRLSADVLLGGLNAKLPDDAVVRNIELAPDGFHATHDAKRKRYRFSFYNDHRRPLFCRRHAWHVLSQLDVAAMNRAAQPLVGTHDFASFQSVGSERESTVRTIFDAAVQCRAEQGRGGAALDDETAALIDFEVEGDGFLYNMVRASAGSLVEVGRGRRDENWLAEVVAARDRSAAGQTAPPHGLMLLWVAY